MGYDVLWATFTSSLASTEGALVGNFQAWRKRLARHLALQPSDIGYRLVQTTEGNGVIHALVALPPGSRLKLRRSFPAMRQWWEDLHAAPLCKFKWFRKRDAAVGVGRLSNYLVQYVAGQDSLVRCSGSKLPVSVPSLRKQWRSYWQSFCDRTRRGMVSAAIGMGTGDAQLVELLGIWWRQWWNEDKRRFGEFLLTGQVRLRGDYAGVGQVDIRLCNAFGKVAEV